MKVRKVGKMLKRLMKQDRYCSQAFNLAQNVAVGIR